jgi:hypothetical protein
MDKKYYKTNLKILLKFNLNLKYLFNFQIFCSKSRIKFTDKKTAQIVKNSLDVDEEYSENVKRALHIEEVENGEVFLIL